MKTPTHSEATHPYAVHMLLALGSNIELDLSDDQFQLPFGKEHVLRIKKELATQAENAADVKRVSLGLEAFATAAEAEDAGKRLAFAILWFAASKRVTVAFKRWTGLYPFAVHNRTLALGASSSGEGRGFFRVTPGTMLQIAGEAFELRRDVESNVLTSMEFYAAARMESTDQARLIALMTALEALTMPQDHGEDVARLLSALADQLEKDPALAVRDAALKRSIAGRVRQLRRESVRQAIVRMVRDGIPEKETLDFVDYAYDVRSKLLHEGARSIDLHDVANRLEDVVRKLYSSMFGLKLVTPQNP